MIAGHYRLVEHIGSGAMGIVWRAIDERLERSVAVKQILTQPGLSDAERDTVRQRAMREARNAARFQHPNAIVVFDIAEHGDEPCLVMEYLPSRSLSAILIEHETLPVPEVARIGEQVASALIAAHRAGIVHRDIKPGNILIDDNGVCKITDFGISRATGDLTLTQTGLIGGTPAYLAPELARGADPKPSSDVFALGATLYHAIEGLPPYGDNTNQLALLYAAANGKVNPPKHAGPATALLMRLLAAEPDERPSMTESRDQLAALAKGQSGVAATRVAPTTAQPPTAEPARNAAPAPAAPAGPPPWRRSPAPEQPPRAPTSTFQPAWESSGSGGSGGDRRKQLVFGAVGVAVLVLASVLVIVLTSSGDDNPNAQQGGPSTGATTSHTSGASSPAPTTVRNTGGDVKWSPAGERVLEYYTDPEKGWDLLTPQSQALFGSEQEHERYWENKDIELAENARAYKRTNNPDGSVDIRVYVDFGAGRQPLYLTVLSVNGVLLLEGDPRPEHNREL